MNVEKKTYREILNGISCSPPEMGGILGGCQSIIRKVEFDEGVKLNGYKPCCYAPDVNRLNQCIELWQAKDIEFYGIFHTHFGGAETLSEGDITYIKSILNTLPEGKDRLYFPVIVLPEKKIVPYIGKRLEGKIDIMRDKLCIV